MDAVRFCLLLQFGLSFNQNSLHWLGVEGLDHLGASLQFYYTGLLRESNPSQLKMANVKTRKQNIIRPRVTPSCTGKAPVFTPLSKWEQGLLA